MDVKNYIKNIAADYFKIAKEEVNVKERFLGGMSNYTYLVNALDNKYVVRKIGDEGLPIINPKTEKDHLNLIKDLHINSELIYINTLNGDKISKYIKGHALSVNYLEDDLILVSNILKKLHQENLVGHDYELIDRLNHYEKLLKDTPSNKYFQLKEFWLNLYNNKYINYQKVFCHGDAQRSNIVKTSNNELFLLDWEFAGMNDPFYDIASFGNIDFNDAEKLLEIYLGYKPSDEELKRLRFYRMYQVLQWHIVAQYKEERGLSEKLHLDFAKISSNYLLFAEVLYNKIKGD